MVVALRFRFIISCALFVVLYLDIESQSYFERRVRQENLLRSRVHDIQWL